MTLVLAFAIGIVAGLRSMTAPAIAAWSAHWGWIDLAGTSLAFLGSPAARWLLLAAMLGELVADKLPFTPNRTKPGPFAARLLSGALAGAAQTVGSGGSLAAGALAGAFGGVVGTLGGYRARTGLVRTLQTPDYVVALVEDGIAVGGALLIYSSTR